MYPGVGVPRPSVCCRIHTCEAALRRLRRSADHPLDDRAIGAVDGEAYGLACDSGTEFEGFTPGVETGKDDVTAFRFELPAATDGLEMVVSHIR